MLQEGVLREECPPPTLFAVVQALGAGAHRAIIARQKAAADVILADPEWGPLIRSINHAEVKSGMRQQVPLVLAEALRERCAAPGYGTSLDEGMLPGLLCAIAHKMRPRFEEALLAVAEVVAPGAVGSEWAVAQDEGFEDGRKRAQTRIAAGEAAEEQEGEATGDTAVKLKVGPVKRINRIAVKIDEYRKERGEDEWPHSQFITDVLRASFIVSTAEEMVLVWRSLLASSDFEVVRLKNKIGQSLEPFNLHVNVLFKPPECEEPIVCEVQFYPRKVFDLQHRQHLAYELKRAKSVGDFQ